MPKAAACAAAGPVFRFRNDKKIEREQTVNLYAKLLERDAAGRPVTVGVIGAGKFGTMFLSQARLTTGMQIVAVADLDVARARSQLDTAGWPAELYAAPSLAEAHKRRATFITD